MKIAGIKLQPAGVKRPNGPEVAEPSKEAGDEMRYPTLYVNDEEMPAIKSKDLKDKCLLVAVVKVKERADRTTMRDGKEEEETTATFEILKAGLKPIGSEDEDPADMSDEEIDEHVKQAIPKSKGSY